MTENVNPADQNQIDSGTAQENTAVESTATDQVSETSAETTENAPEQSATEASSATEGSTEASPEGEPEAASAESSPPVSEPLAEAESSSVEETPSAEGTPAEGTSGESSTETAAPEASVATEGEAAQTTATEEAPAAATDSSEGTTEGGTEPEPEPGMSLEEMRQIWDELEAMKNNREAIDVTVTGANRGGVVTEYKGVEIFVPLSHWSIDRSTETSNIQTGEQVALYILEMSHFDTDARRVTGTRRSILRKVLIDSLEVGQRLTGRISSITEFGAFVDIGGVDGLLHVSEMSYARNKQPNALVKKGEELEVIIKLIEKGGKRISLGHKELFNSPWVGIAEKYPPDSVQKGKVVSLTELGAFVELEPGVDGLIRPRELSWTQRVGAASDVLSIGQEVDVMVLNVNEEQERMSLSLKRAAENPWPQIVEKFTGDTLWEAEVKELSNKGAVIAVDGVEGFLPRGRMGRDARKLTEMKAGDKLQVRVVEIDPKRPSVIFGIPMESGGGGGGFAGGNSGGGRDRDNRGEGGGGGRRGGRDRDRGPAEPATPLNEMKTAATVSSFSLGDMLGDALREKLGIEPEPTPEPTPEPPAAPADSAPPVAAGSDNSGESAAATEPTATAEEGTPSAGEASENAPSEGTTEATSEGGDDASAESAPEEKGGEG